MIIDKELVQDKETWSWKVIWLQYPQSFAIVWGLLELSSRRAGELHWLPYAEMVFARCQETLTPPTMGLLYYCASLAIRYVTYTKGYLHFD